MKLNLRTRGIPMSQALRKHVEKRVRFALGRFGERVRAVHVQLTDVNGPRGGEDVECLVEASLAPTGTVRISETSLDPFRAVARASDRIGYRLRRHLDRARTLRRRS